MFWLLPRPGLQTVLAVVGIVAVASMLGIDLLGLATDFLSSLWQPDWWPF